MPQLPSPMGARLRRTSKKLLAALGRMDNIDHRRGIARMLQPRERQNTTYWGNRIRLLRTTRAIPPEIVLKRSHEQSAPRVVENS